MKLALIGKNISHSKSQQMYEEILNRPVDYTLLDFESEEDIPPLNKIFKENQFTGISVTAPYKNFVFKNVKADRFATSLEAVNCVKYFKDELLGINTDFLATLNILERNINDYDDIVILGSGAMFRTCALALTHLKKEFIQYSRKLNGKLEDLDLTKYRNSLVINSCSRDFLFSGTISEDSLFWDLNYSHQHNQSYLSDKCQYVDGIELLKLQAIYALEFWGIS
ncbi:MAG: hypothetical protein GY909_12190 [Oligoflexia bacterium]|nr:hypothetical protein [Oligoflexia bacterium]